MGTTKCSGFVAKELKLQQHENMLQFQFLYFMPLSAKKKKWSGVCASEKEF